MAINNLAAIGVSRFETGNETYSDINKDLQELNSTLLEVMELSSQSGNSYNTFALNFTQPKNKGDTQSFQRKLAFNDDPTGATIEFDGKKGPAGQLISYVSTQIKMTKLGALYDFSEDRSALSLNDPIKEGMATLVNQMTEYKNNKTGIALFEGASKVILAADSKNPKVSVYADMLAKVNGEINVSGSTVTGVLTQSIVADLVDSFTENMEEYNIGGTIVGGKAPILGFEGKDSGYKLLVSKKTMTTLLRDPEFKAELAGITQSAYLIDKFPTRWGFEVIRIQNPIKAVVGKGGDINYSLKWNSITDTIVECSFLIGRGQYGTLTQDSVKFMQYNINYDAPSLDDKFGTNAFMAAKTRFGASVFNSRGVFAIIHTNTYTPLTVATDKVKGTLGNSAGNPASKFSPNMGDNKVVDAKVVVKQALRALKANVNSWLKADALNALTLTDFTNVTDGDVLAKLGLHQFSEAILPTLTVKTITAGTGGTGPSVTYTAAYDGYSDDSNAIEIKPTK